MSRGRHRGRRHWGILPTTGRSIAFLPQDMAIISVRCFTTGLFLFGLAGFLLMTTESHEGWNVLIGAAIAVFATLFIVGVGLLSYAGSTIRHIKALEADGWLHAVQEHRVARLTQREQFLMSSIAELSEHFEEEKAALKEVREERIAQERMVGFLRGIQESPAMRAYHANPRNRLRVVSDSSEEPA